MPLKSDLEINFPQFDPKNITEKTHKFNEKLIDIMQGGPKWYEVGAEKYREMRWNGETPLPKPTVLPQGLSLSIPSTHGSHPIPCRLFTTPSPSAVFLHIHGGGWVLQSETYQDLYLAHLSTTYNLAVLSVGYRLAPENPYPAAQQDCYDVARYLLGEEGRREVGKGTAGLGFIGGESAGGHLAAVTGLRLAKEGLWDGNGGKGGLVLNFGAYNLASWGPQAMNWNSGREDGTPLVLDLDLMERYREVYLPGMSEKERMDPDVSPLYTDLTKIKKLPPALFTCGTADCLLDDSVFMCTKWKMAGGDATLRIFPGGAHGYMMFSPDTPGVTETAQQGLDAIGEFIKERLGS